MPSRKRRVDVRNVVTVKIHPAIGIARIGNSPTEFFIGPETPGRYVRPRAGYKDGQGRVKRQAARFRLFGYDNRGRVVKELTTVDATINWTVHLANKKAAWRQFDGPDPETPFRNPNVTDRQRLVIDPGPRSLTGRGQHAEFDTGLFLGRRVPLGDARTDRSGRLLVLGGFGHSGSPVKAELTTYANNDGWHDDVSDGPVRAVVTLRANGASLEAVPAWVIVGPPKFTPGIENIITLYDTLFQVAVDQLGVDVPTKPSFRDDIYPLLRRAMSMKWVSRMVAHPDGHHHDEDSHDESHDEASPEHGDDHDDEGAHDEEGKPAHATFAGVIPPPGSRSARRAIFDKLRDPALAPNEDSGESDMPMIWSDVYLGGHNQPLTRVQYEMMRKWSEGAFVNDWSKRRHPPHRVTPEGLDRAALESCVGGAFYPGLEASWMLRDTYSYLEPFRLDPAGLEPGDVTKQLAVPWQADFFDCQQEDELAWWPAQRPDAVYPRAGAEQVDWTRGLVRSSAEMVKRWHRLGFVVKRGRRYLESERDD